jgi:hypothetical protein
MSERAHHLYVLLSQIPQNDIINSYNVLLGQAQALFIQHAGHTYDVITFKKSTGRTVAQVIVYYKLNSKEQWKVLKKGEPDTVVSTALENLLQSLEKEIGIKAGKLGQSKK